MDPNATLSPTNGFFHPRTPQNRASRSNHHQQSDNCLAPQAAPSRPGFGSRPTTDSTLRRSESVQSSEVARPLVKTSTFGILFPELNQDLFDSLPIFLDEFKPSQDDRGRKMIALWARRNRIALEHVEDYMVLLNEPRTSGNEVPFIFPAESLPILFPDISSLMFKNLERLLIDFGGPPTPSILMIWTTRLNLVVQDVQDWVQLTILKSGFTADDWVEA